LEPLDALLEAVQEAERKLLRWAKALSGKSYVGRLNG
jgi:hypothetical protein